MPAENKDDKSFGLILKEARLAKNISLEEASKHTRIHVNILRSIESDDVKSLGAVYAKSFLKLYAEYLGVDKDDCLRRFSNATGIEVRGAAKVRFPVEQELKSQVATSVDRVLSFFARTFNRVNFKVILFVLAALFLVWGIVKFATHHRSAPRIPKKVEAKKADILRELPVARPLVRDLDESQRLTVAKASVASEDAPAAVAAPQEKIQKKIVLVIRAKEKSWLQVKSDGKIVFQSVLSKGSAESWQAADKIELMLGDAGAVQLELNGRLLQKIGRPGQTLKHVVVTKSGLSIRR